MVVIITSSNGDVNCNAKLPIETLAVPIILGLLKLVVNSNVGKTRLAVPSTDTVPKLKLATFVVSVTLAVPTVVTASKPSDKLNAKLGRVKLAVPEVLIKPYCS